jgi:hypothetical protein
MLTGEIVKKKKKEEGRTLKSQAINQARSSSFSPSEKFKIIIITVIVFHFCLRREEKKVPV